MASQRGLIWLVAWSCHDCPKCILQTALMANTQQYFILKVLESGGWGSVVLSHSWDHLTICKQMSFGSSKNEVTYKLFAYKSLIYMHKQDLPLKKPYGFICHKTITINHVLGMTFNCIWWWDWCSGALRNVEYPFIAITPRFTLPGVVVPVRVLELFNHFLYLKPIVCKQMINVQYNY